MNRIPLFLYLLLALLPVNPAFAGVVFTDDFTDGNDNGWTKPVPTGFTVESGEYSRSLTSNDNDSTIAYVGDNSWTDYTVETDAKLIDDVPGGWAVLCFRVVDPLRFYYLMFEPHSATVKIQSLNGTVGSYTVLGSVSLATSKNIWYRLKATVRGDSIFGYVNGTLLISARDTRYAAGGAGVTAWHSHSHYDNFTVTAPDCDFPVTLINAANPTRNRRPLLKWFHHDSIAVYKIMADTTPAFSDPIFSVPVSDTFYLPTVNLPLDTIYWKVLDNAGSRFWSAVSNFTVVDSLVPLLIAYQPDPTSNRKPLLKWYNVNGAGSYTIQIASDEAFTSPILVPTTDTFYAPGVNLPLGMTWWKVRSDLNAAYSMPDSFLIQSDSVPVVISVTPDTQTNRRPTMTWHKAAGATVYKIQIDTTGDFLNPWLSSLTNDTFFVPPVNLPLSEICWRVSSQDYDANQYSAVDTFLVRSTTAREEGALLPRAFGMGNGNPNPFNPSTVISVAVPGTGLRGRQVTVAVYDLKGRLVKTLVNGLLSPGYHDITFDGRYDNGQGTASGIYFCKMTADRFQKTVRMVMIK